MWMGVNKGINIYDINKKETTRLYLYYRIIQNHRKDAKRIKSTTQVFIVVEVKHNERRCGESEAPRRSHHDFSLEEKKLKITTMRMTTPGGNDTSGRVRSQFHWPVQSRVRVATQ